MTEQLAITLSAASIGFLAAIFFCVGNAMNSAAKILQQATSFSSTSEPLAKALAAQRAQYIVGALLLVASFLLQVWTTLTPATSSGNLPQWLQTWPCFLLAVLAPSTLGAGGLSWLLYKFTMHKVLRLHREKLVEEEQQKIRQRP